MIDVAGSTLRMVAVGDVDDRSPCRHDLRAAEENMVAPQEHVVHDHLSAPAATMSAVEQLTQLAAVHVEQRSAPLGVLDEWGDELALRGVLRRCTVLAARKGDTGHRQQ